MKDARGTGLSRNRLVFITLRETLGLLAPSYLTSQQSPTKTIAHFVHSIAAPVLDSALMCSACSPYWPSLMARPCTYFTVYLRRRFVVRIRITFAVATSFEFVQSVFAIVHCSGASPQMQELCLVGAMLLHETGVAPWHSWSDNLCVKQHGRMRC